MQLIRRMWVIILGLFFALTTCPQARSDDQPDDVLVIRELRYREGESKNWALDLARPKGDVATLRPAIVIIHGGGWKFGNKSSFSKSDSPAPGNIVDFARLGFVAATINYRLSTEAVWPAALHDCKNAVRYLRAHAKEHGIDPTRIGVWGNSAGGHLALLLGLTESQSKWEGDGPHLDQSSSVQSVFSDSGPIDLVHQHQQDQVRMVIEELFGGPPEGPRLDDYRAASPINYVNGKCPPTLLVYGAADEQVGIETADQFLVAATQAGHRDISYIRLANVRHCPFSIRRIAFLTPIVNEFFTRTLRLQDAPKP
ncbi:alpha/beta hydrolase family protein [Schlesneria paludicola]|uniref:alpha/beta hydrolase family protein n=1 Tax=Schlesneria paludicola TaxID=360056 RepID=UPI000299F15D|nr:alpha/beta hydrolase [Schlesneria paludicola]